MTPCILSFISIFSLDTGLIQPWFCLEDVTLHLPVSNSGWKKWTLHTKKDSMFHKGWNSSKHDNIFCSSRAALIRTGVLENYLRSPGHVTPAPALHDWDAVAPAQVSPQFSPLLFCCNFVLSAHAPERRMSVSYHRSCWGESLDQELLSVPDQPKDCFRWVRYLW